MSIFCILVLLLFGTVSSIHAEQPLTVHVLLEKKIEGTDDLSWVIHAKHGFTLRDPYQTDHYDHIDGHTCKLTYKQGALWVGKKKLAKNRIMLEPQEGALEYNDKRYAGSLALIAEGGTWHLINRVDLEAYVCSVLRSESWPGWPLEVNKSFAIMQRSYVVAKVIQARAKRKKGKPILFDIGCTNRDQTYQGMHDCPLLQQAVDETKGMVLAYKKKPVMAMYDVCCGGLVPAKMKGVDFAGSPYLARAYPCTFCTNCKVYSWKVTYTLPHCEQLFNKAGVVIKDLQELKVTKYDAAGLVQEIQVRAGKKWHTITGKKMYNICKDIKSFSFSISQHAKSVTFSGRGYGHHLGVCQWGARQMFDEGWNYKEILQFYYPDVSFMRVEVLE